MYIPFASDFMLWLLFLSSANSLAILSSRNTPIISWFPLMWLINCTEYNLLMLSIIQDAFRLMVQLYAMSKNRFCHFVAFLAIDKTSSNEQFRQGGVGLLH